MIKTEGNITLVVIITDVKTYLISAPTATRDLNYISLSKLPKDSNKNCVVRLNMLINRQLLVFNQCINCSVDYLLACEILKFYSNSHSKSS